MEQPSSPTVGQKLARLASIIQQQNQAQHVLMNKVNQLQGKLAAVQGQQAVQQPSIREQTFSAAKIKMDLPTKFGGQPAELYSWLFSVEQYCGMVGIVKPVDIVKLAVSRLEHDAFTWWHQLACRGTDYQLSTLGWSDFKSELVDAFADIDCELRLHRQLAFLKQQTSVAIYTKWFKQIVLELGDQAPDDAALLFRFTEGLKADVQMQVLLAQPQILMAAEQVAERADMALFSLGKRQMQQGQQQQRPHQWQPRNYQFQQYRYQRPPPPPPRQGPVPMNLGDLQGQQQHQQNPPKYGASCQITCYRCGKQGHIVKDCRVKIRG